MAHFNPMIVWTKDFYKEVVFGKACKSFLLSKLIFIDLESFPHDEPNWSFQQQYAVNNR